MDHSDGILERKGRMPPDWSMSLSHILASITMKELKSFLKQRIAEGAEIYPPPFKYFNAFNLTPLKSVKVVILGQDPYYGPNQAEGIAFSVTASQRIPPSLHNIHKEIQTDLNITPPNHGSLISWAEKGVLMLNTVLTVERGKPGSHRGKGWESFSDAALQAVVNRNKPCVFMAWGKDAQKVMSRLPLDEQHHLLLKTSHPAPYSAYQGFLGCRHFSKSNEFLIMKGEKPIDWNIDNIVPEIA